MTQLTISNLLRRMSIYSLLHLENRVFVGNLKQKSPIIDGSFAKNYLQLEASNGSWPPYIHVQPIASRVSFLHSQIPIVDLVL